MNDRIQIARDVLGLGDLRGADCLVDMLSDSQAPLAEKGLLAHIPRDLLPKEYATVEQDQKAVWWREWLKQNRSRLRWDSSVREFSVSHTGRP